MTQAMQRCREAVDDIRAELTARCESIDHGALDTDFADVVLGLLSRQFQLWAAIVLSPGAWTSAASPLLLRGLADALITIKWVVANPGQALQFKLYSAGRLKLLSEHWRALGSADADDLAATFADQLVELVNTEQWSAILPVDVGSWSGKNIRTMAQEVGLRDLYDLTYSPLSADAHAEWMTLRTKYLRSCEEILHDRHFLPVFEIPHRRTDVAGAATGLLALSAEAGLVALGLTYAGDTWDSAVAKVAEATSFASQSPAPQLTDNNPT